MTTKPFKSGRGYTKDDWDAVDSPESTDEELATARPFSEVFPDLAASIRNRGPQKAPTKRAISIRLDTEVIDRLRDSGTGWQTRANDMLRKALRIKG